jgi:PAS domain S-box-containing protein
MKIKSVSKILTSALIIANLVIIAMVHRWELGFNELEKNWYSYSENTERKSALINLMQRSLGYNGVIHNLKNYILRHDKTYLLQMHRALQAFNIAIIGFSQLTLTEQEKRQIMILTQLQQRYLDAAIVAEQMTLQGFKRDQIDTKIAVNDIDAIGALAFLENTLANKRHEHLDSISTKVTLQAKYSRILMLLITLLLFGLAISFYWFMRRQVSQPIAALLKAFKWIDPDTNASQRLPITTKVDKNELDELAIVGNRFLDVVERRLGYQKQAEKLATEGKQQITAILNNTAEGIITIDAKGLILSFNPKCEELFGFTASEAIGQNVDVLMRRDERMAHGKYLKRSSHVEKKVINTNRELWGQRKNGDIFPMELTVSSAQLSGQKCFIGVMHDISVRKTNEAKVLAAKDEAEKANQSKSIFLSAMNHELRTPLNAILGFAQLMLMKKHNNQLSLSGQQNIEQILQAGYHLLALVNDILDLSKIESGQFDIELTTVHLSEALQQCLDLVEQQAKSKGVTLIIDPSIESDWQLMCNFTRLKQVLLNLITNAIKYNSTHGNVTVKATRIEHNQLQIDIIDNGVGISEENYQYVFKPFQRFDSQKAAIEGSGIGLSVSASLVEAMKGHINFTSQLGIGSTFTVTLPLIQSASGTHDGIESDVGLTTPMVDCSDKTLLYVEDNTANIQLIEEFVVGCFNLRFATAGDGETALQIVQQIKPNIIIIDIDQQNNNAFEVLRSLKADRLTQHLAVIALSELTTPELAKTITTQGFADYLQKPLDVTKVLELVYKHLDLNKA